MQPHPLAELFPMLPESELRELADDIVTFGQRVPIVLLEGMVLDGRNRLAACAFAEVEPRFVDYDGDDPLNFVLSHNLHRRHLTDSQRAMVAARIVDWETGLNQHSGGAHVPAHKAAERLSISERAVKAARRIHEHGSAELVDAIRDGRLSVKTGEAISHLEQDAQREVLEREEREIIARAKQLRAERQRVRHGERLDNMRRIAGDGAPAASGKVDKKYPVIYADPPWRFGVRSEVTGREKSAENHYPTMDSAEIANLFREIGEPATDDAVLFLWATNPMLHDALRVMAAWDFDYVHHWIWDKEVAGTGYWGRDRHELLLIGRRGDVASPLPGSQPETVYREKKGPHSAKPDFFAETIERLYPAMPRLELFCRSPRPGWDVWGYEATEATAPTKKSPAKKVIEPAHIPADLRPGGSHITELTIGGMQQHVKLGEELAARDALSKTYMTLDPPSKHDAVWSDVVRMLTLNGQQAHRNLEKHVCPLQFDIVDRLIDRYSNKGDVIYDPFGGLMTVPYRAILKGRRGWASELSDTYFRDGVRYCRMAEAKVAVPSMFDILGIGEGLEAAE